MSPQSAVAASLFESDVPVCAVREVTADSAATERTAAARIVFDRLPIEMVPAFPPAVPLRPLRLVPTPAAADEPMPCDVAAPGRLRLTPRGRIVLVVLAALVLSVVAVLVRTATSSASGPAATVSHPVVVVQPGDTLWSIATRVARHADPRATVQELVDLNRLSGTGIQAGEQLNLPS